MRLFLFLILAVFSSQFSNAQDSTMMSLRRNTIKIDFTGNLIYSNHYNVSFERVVKQNQSYVVTLGYQEFPKIINLGQYIEGERDINRSGYRVGAEYRFYLKKENKFAAPRGVYIGPYVTSLGFKSDQGIVYSGSDVLEEADMRSRINIFSIGAQLGYQFVFNDRWSIDLVLVGPSVSKYNFKTQLEGDFNFDPEDVQDEILQALIEKFPLLEDFLNEEELNSSGRLNTWSLGYKYQFLIGYRFGKYKNLKKK
ncbi:DUF3575 domain-containing protein [Algoriphagus marinus]|uniref:DUF3575 domain-containing protein n=1 Tax=Algoriphagus marinus TaxID=1925762 RepID=UPI0015881F6F|nr:DUF3575 domain-containing protein [Algoriphagus marinus]